MSYNPYVNPYARPTPAYPAGPSVPLASTSSAASSSYNLQIPAGYDPTTAAAYDAALMEQQSIYTPEAAKRAPASGPAPKEKHSRGRTTVLRKGGGEVWEDQTLMEWDPSHFRLFIGNLDPALADDVFQAAFSNPRYPSFVKAKIVRDKHTNKGRGYGFVSYKDPEDFLKAWKEMNGKYVGTRPVKISKATAGVQTVEIGTKKARLLDAKVKAKSGTVAFSRAKLAEAEGGGLNRRDGYGQRDRKSYIRR